MAPKPPIKKARLPIVNVGDARIFFRNFSGKPGKFNREGDRSFCVHLDKPGMADDLKKQGWNVRYTKPRSEEDIPEPYVQVKVSFAKFPPKVALIKGDKKPIYLTEEDISLLDWADISKADLVLNPSVWNVNGGTGVKAYLKAGYFTVIEDAFEAKYQNPADTGDEELHKEEDD